MPTLRRRLALAACLLSPLLAPLGALAQDWPNKPIRLVINFAPGSSPDVLGRAVATPLSQALGVPVIGYRTDRFPAFYTRDGGCGVDARFDDAATMAAFVRHEMARTCRGVVIANPIPEADEIDPVKFAGWLAQAEAEAAAKGATGRAVTPAVLGALHRLSGGATLRANIALVRHNVAVAAEVAVAMGEP